MSTCPECGLRAGEGEPDCAELRDRLFARFYEQPALYGRHHRLAIDTYCVQHSAYVESAKSFAAHLCGLCIAFEHDNHTAAQCRVQQWLNGTSPLQKPDLPAARGRFTVQHLSGVDDPVAFGRAVREWAQSAWEAYRELHPIARQWVSQAMATR